MKSSSWQLVGCGVTHKTSSVAQREPFQIGSNEQARANAVFGALPPVREAVVLATCNRVEFYFVTDASSEPMDVVTSFYHSFRGESLNVDHSLFRVWGGEHAADHLFSVAAGIDSMVVGETQILGQVKDAYSAACAVKSTGKIIHRLFHQAFRVGKQVRTDTEMGRGTCSVASAAIDFLRERIGENNRPRVVLVGVNRMVKLAADYLKRTGVESMHFVNRTPEKAEQLAASFGATGGALADLPNQLATCDVMISCTSAPTAIVTNEMLAHRDGARLIVLDLAIPRDVDCSGGDGIEVYDLEAIKAFVSAQQQRRLDAVPEAEQIVQRRLEEFEFWWRHVSNEPMYSGDSKTYEAIRSEEIQVLLDRLPPELQNELNQVTRRIVDRVVNVAARGHADKSE